MSASPFSPAVADNAYRAMLARQAISQFRRTTNAQTPFALRDLLSNLMHYCNEGGIDFWRELEIAEVFYSHEIELAQANEDFDGGEL